MPQKNKIYVSVFFVLKGKYSMKPKCSSNKILK